RLPCCRPYRPPSCSVNLHRAGRIRSLYVDILWISRLSTTLRFMKRGTSVSFGALVLVLGLVLSPVTPVSAATPRAGSVIQKNRRAEASYAPAVPAAPNSKGKSILVSLARQRMWAYKDGELVHTFLVSTGLAERATKAGKFFIKTKLPEAWSSAWQLRMPYWMGIYDVGRIENGIHAMPLRNGRLVRWRVGYPGSYGCVVLNTDDAITLYRWVDLGTPVVITRR
ncbi:L,D-transpeptidase, partial [Chromohalobacter sp.]|uniref:L,D-transpeptidase n=1 Tax=Chromohalobacter sp. TaxID=50740 RepID=UPI0025865A17